MDRKWILVAAVCVLLIVGFLVFLPTRGPRDTNGMTPGAATRAFFTAMSAGDGNALDQYLPEPGMFFQLPGFRERALGLKIISVGEPFQKPKFPGKSLWFVPYEIRLKTGEIRKGDLCLQSCHPAHMGRWTFGGGF